MNTDRLQYWPRLTDAQRTEATQLAQRTIVSADQAARLVLIAHNQIKATQEEVWAAWEIYRQAGLPHPSAPRRVHVDAPLVISAASRAKPKPPRENKNLSRRERKALKAKGGRA